MHIHEALSLSLCLSLSVSLARSLARSLAMHIHEADGWYSCTHTHNHLGEIVRGHLHRDLVSREDLDEVLADLARNVGKDLPVSGSMV